MNDDIKYIGNFTNDEIENRSSIKSSKEKKNKEKIRQNLWKPQKDQSSFEPLWLKPADMKSKTEQEDARK